MKRLTVGFILGSLILIVSCGGGSSSPDSTSPSSTVCDCQCALGWRLAGIKYHNRSSSGSPGEAENLLASIATHLRDFDEHVLFASANEPHVEDATQMDVLLSYYQAFVDAVRTTGGKNAYRVLVVQGPSTDVDKTHELMTAMPQDSVAGRMMAEVHFYSPWNYTGMQKDEVLG